MSVRATAQWLAELRRHGGDGAAAEDLRQYLRRGLAKALRSRRVAEADLDDLAQEGLVRILEGLDGFRGDSAFTTWALAVALRAAFGLLRRRQHDPRALDELLSIESGDEDCDPARIAQRGDLLAALHRSIQRDLTVRQRTAILGELSGVPTAELAQRLGIKPNALYKLHHDARKNLRRALSAAGFGAGDVREELARATKTT